MFIGTAALEIRINSYILSVRVLKPLELTGVNPSPVRETSEHCQKQCANHRNQGCNDCSTVATSYFPAQKCLLQMSKIRNRACGLWPFSHFSSFSFWPGRRPHLNLYPVSFAARNRPILIRLSAITPKPTQRCIPASPRSRQ